MQEAFQLCETHVREADKDRFLATLFAPEHYRGALFSLYAFDVEIAAVRDRISSPLPGEVRLQWWRDVLTGTEPGDAAANPIAAGLLATVGRHDLPASSLLDLIDAHTFDLYDEPMATIAEFENYAVATSGTVFRLAAHILGGALEPRVEACARHAGIAWTVSTTLQRLGRDAARGQRFVPDELLIRHGASANVLHAGQVTDELRAALGDLRQLAERHLAALQVGDGGIPHRMLPAFLPASLVPHALACMARPRSDPLQPSFVPQWRRQWSLWRAARDPGRFIRVWRDDPAENAGRQ